MQADPRNIAVPDGFVNMIATDIRGLTFSRTPQQVHSRPHKTCMASPKFQLMCSQPHARLCCLGSDCVAHLVRRCDVLEGLGAIRMYLRMMRLCMDSKCMGMVAQVSSGELGLSVSPSQISLNAAAPQTLK